MVTPNTGLVVSIAGTPTVEAITEAAASRAPSGAAAAVEGEAHARQLPRGRRRLCPVQEAQTGPEKVAGCGSSPSAADGSVLATARQRCAAKSRTSSTRRSAHRRLVEAAAATAAGNLGVAITFSEHGLTTLTLHRPRPRPKRRYLTQKWLKFGISLPSPLAAPMLDGLRTPDP